MLTRRDCVVGLVAASLTAGVFALASNAPTQGSWVKDLDSVPAKPTESGSVRSLYNGPTATLKNLDVHVTTLNPGGAPHPPHKHPNEEILIIQQGTLEALINGQWMKVGPGDVILRINNTEITSVKTFRETVAKLDLKKPVSLLVRDQDGQRFITFRPEVG